MKIIIYSAILCGILLTSCNSENDNIINLIPSEVSCVAKINLKQIKEKNTNLSGIINYMAGESDEIITKIYNSGVDLEKSLISFVGKLDEHTPYYGALFSISSQNQFKSTLKAELNCSFEQDGPTTIALLPDRKGIITWKENTALWINIPDQEIATKIINLSGDSKALVDARPNFKNSIEKENDVSLWVNLEEVKSISHHLNPNISAIQDEIDLSNSFLTSTIDFNNGEIIIENRLNGNDNNFTTYRKLYNKKLNPSLLTLASGEDLIFAYLMNLNLEEVFNLVKDDENLNEELDAFLSRINIKPEALEKVLTGEAIFTINGLDGFIPFNYKSSIVLGLKDSNKANAILESLDLYGLQYNPQKELYECPFFLAKIKNKGLILAGPNKDFAAKLLDGLGPKLKEIEISNTNGELRMNLNQIPSFLLRNISKFVPLIKEVESISSSNELGDHEIKNEIKINLKQDDINSLSVLAKQIKETI